jgi:hypothetical protein
VALLLRKRGVIRIRPLAGGYHAWTAQGFPVEALGGEAERLPRASGVR